MFFVNKLFFFSYKLCIYLNVFLGQHIGVEILNKQEDS